MNIIEKTQPSVIQVENENTVFFRFDDKGQDEFIRFLKGREIEFTTLCKPSLTNIRINIEDYLSILDCIVDIERKEDCSMIHLNNAVVHINNVGNGKCDKIEVDYNNMNVYKDGERIFSIFWDLHAINQLSISTDIGDKRYGPNFIPLEWFKREFKNIEYNLDDDY